VLERWRNWSRRRAAERWARADALDRAAFGILERLAKPLVSGGVASLVWVDEKEGLVLRPTEPAAAAVGLYPGRHMHSLLVGPEGNLHEVRVQRGAGWRDELEACLQAVVEGRYVEEVSDDGSQVTMTFGVPHGADTVTRHVGRGGDGYGEPGVHRYAPYAPPSPESGDVSRA
jgi:hypothetical protein